VRYFVSLNVSLSHSRSLECLSTVSYSHSILTMVLSCSISELKRDLVENRGFFMLPFSMTLSDL